MIQRWVCDVCAAVGHIHYDKHEDAYGVITKIRDDHNRESPDCRRGDMVRLLAPLDPRPN